MERGCGVGTPPAGELLQKHVTSTTPSSSPPPPPPRSAPTRWRRLRCRREDCFPPWRRPKPEASAQPTDETSLICASATTVRDIT